MTTSEKAFFYIHKNPPLSDGQYLKAWRLATLNQQRTLTSGVVYNSSKALELYNCKATTVAIRQVAYYLNVAGVGSPVLTLVYLNNEVEFIDQIPRSTGNTLLDYVCGKLKYKLTAPTRPVGIQGGLHEARSNFSVMSGFDWLRGNTYALATSSHATDEPGQMQ